MWIQVLNRGGRRHWVPGTGVAGSREPPGMGTGNQTQAPGSSAPLPLQPQGCISSDRPSVLGPQGPEEQTAAGCGKQQSNWAQLPVVLAGLLKCGNISQFLYFICCYCICVCVCTGAHYHSACVKVRGFLGGGSVLLWVPNGTLVWRMLYLLSSLTSPKRGNFAFILGLLPVSPTQSLLTFELQWTLHVQGSHTLMVMALLL